MLMAEIFHQVNYTYSNRLITYEIPSTNDKISVINSR